MTQSMIIKNLFEQILGVLWANTEHIVMRFKVSKTLIKELSWIIKLF